MPLEDISLIMTQYKWNGKNNQAMQNDSLEYRFLDQPISIEFVEFVNFSTAYEILIGKNWHAWFMDSKFRTKNQSVRWISNHFIA